MSVAVVKPSQMPIRFGLAAGAMALAVFALVMGIVCLKGITRTRRVEWLAILIAFLLSGTVICVSIDVGSAALSSGMSSANCTCEP